MKLLASQNEVFELFINRKVDEEVGEVVDESDVQKILVYLYARELYDNYRQVRDDGEKQETHSNLDRLHVLLVCLLVASERFGTRHYITLHNITLHYIILRLHYFSRNRTRCASIHRDSGSPGSVEKRLQSRDQPIRTIAQPAEPKQEP